MVRERVSKKARLVPDANEIPTPDEEEEEDEADLVVYSDEENEDEEKRHGIHAAASYRDDDDDEELDALTDPAQYLDAKRFQDLPLCSATANALRRCKYDTMTGIQRTTLPYSLCGYDVVGCAKTGSGKTLAFVIPVLERLRREKWSRELGLGALILSPTRELAIQIFETMRNVGRFHRAISAGIATGGMSLQEEQAFISGMNILVATPGRLLQHLDEVASFDVNSLLLLVLDEADRLLDHSFARTMRCILADHLVHTNGTRQTLLFSATLRMEVTVPSYLPLREPVQYLAAGATAQATHVGSALPTRLCQSFIVLPAEAKLSFLYSFLLAHDRHKTMVFFATCHEVKFAFTILSRLLRTKGVACAALTGKMRQHQRKEVFQVCTQRSGAMVLFCTDVACRGLDLPEVRWVVQYDCCDSPATYIHRVGRTARAGGKGSSLLMLLPSEVDMLYYLYTDAGIRDLREVRVRPGKHLHCIEDLVAAEVARDAKALAQRALISYVRCLSQSECPTIFQVDAIDIDALARSFGLVSAPSRKAMKLGERKPKNLTWGAYNQEQQASQRNTKTTVDTATTTATSVDSPATTSSSIHSATGSTGRTLTKAERKRRASHMQRVLEQATDLVEGAQSAWTTPAAPSTHAFDATADEDILHLEGTVSAHELEGVRAAQFQVEKLSKKSQQLFDQRRGVDVKVGALGLSTRHTFEDPESD